MPQLKNSQLQEHRCEAHRDRPAVETSFWDFTITSLSTTTVVMGDYEIVMDH